MFFFLFKLGECACFFFCLWINDNYNKDDIDSNMFRTFVVFCISNFGMTKKCTLVTRSSRVASVACSLIIIKIVSACRYVCLLVGWLVGWLLLFCHMICCCVILESSTPACMDSFVNIQWRFLRKTFHAHLERTLERTFSGMYSHVYIKIWFTAEGGWTLNTLERSSLHWIWCDGVPFQWKQMFWYFGSCPLWFFVCKWPFMC